MVTRGGWAFVPTAAEKRKRVTTHPPRSFWTIHFPITCRSFRPVAAVTKATGLSCSYWSRVRRGQCVPHPRHWAEVRELLRESWKATIKRRATCIDDAGDCLGEGLRQVDHAYPAKVAIDIRRKGIEELCAAESVFTL